MYQNNSMLRFKKLNPSVLWMSMTFLICGTLANPQKETVKRFSACFKINRFVILLRPIKIRLSRSKDLFCPKSQVFPVLPADKISTLPTLLWNPPRKSNSSGNNDFQSHFVSVIIHFLTMYLSVFGFSDQILAYSSQPAHSNVETERERATPC